MYNNPYMSTYSNNYNQQSINDRIDNQIAQLQQMKEQMKQNHMQQPAINQTFQLASNNAKIKYANTIEEVSKETVMDDTPFFSKDMSVVWIKNVRGDIKSYELKEIVKKDEKDLLIDALMLQIEDLKGKINDEQPNTNVIEPKIATNSKYYDEADGETIETSKPSSISRISKSKK